MQRKISLGELPPPFIVRPVKQEGIELYDKDNAYPTRMERIIDGSVTAKSSAGMLSRFLVGKGFKDPLLNTLQIGKDRYERPITAYKLLRQIAKSLSYYAGFYVRAQFNGLLAVTAFDHVNFKHCRFGLKDTQDYSGRIVIYNNWDKSLGQVKKKDFIPVHVWNMDKDVIQFQINKAGGILKYKGQVYFNFTDEYYIYPMSPIDPVHFDADTENQISKFTNGEVRRGFFMKKIIHHNRFDSQNDADNFKDKLLEFQGGGHQSSFLVVEGLFDEEGNLRTNDNIKIENVEQNINDKIFESYGKSVINNIRKAYNAIPQILIDYEDGKLGTTSGEALYQASIFYNQMTQELRTFISESFHEMFSKWHQPEYNDKDWAIEELILGIKSEQGPMMLKLEGSK